MGNQTWEKSWEKPGGQQKANGNLCGDFKMFIYKSAAKMILPAFSIQIITDFRRKIQTMEASMGEAWEKHGRSMGEMRGRSAWEKHGRK